MSYVDRMIYFEKLWQLQTKSSENLESLTSYFDYIYMLDCVDMY